jgi:hypothetical protein
MSSTVAGTGSSRRSWSTAHPIRTKAGLAAHLDAGANHVSVQVLAAPSDDPMLGYLALARVLAEIN